MAIRGLKKPSEFKRTMNAGHKWVTPGFVCLWDCEDASLPVGFGVVASKKVGNAVARNRVKRRLRVLFREQMAGNLPPGDYVLIGRKAACDMSYDDLLAAAAACVKAINRQESKPKKDAEK